MDLKERTYRISALGCRTNQYEAQAFRDQLEAVGFRPAEKDESADLCIVNSCTVTAAADRDSRGVIRRLVKQNPGAMVAVTGCASEGKAEEILAIEGVTHVVGNQDKELLIEQILPGEEIPEFSIKNFDAHTRAFVKVQDGCNSYCTYCIIPYVRGRSRSRTMKEIVQECEALISNGYKEIVLTGINIGDFDGAKSQGEKPDTLADLVRAVDVLPGLERLRISSIDPDEVDDDLMDAVINGKHTCHSMHIVLQSGSNVVLKRMNRKYTRQMFLESIERLRGASPDFTFTTDVIVGFPGETEADFQETLDVMSEVQFAKVHMFPFSPRKRTRAATMPNQVASEVIRERKQRLLRQAERDAYQLREKYLGRRMWVLTESKTESAISGHTDNFLMASFDGEGLSSNELVEVCLQENSPEGFVAKRIDTAEERCV